MKKLALFLSPLISITVVAQDPATMNITVGETYTIKFTECAGFVYHKANDFKYLYAENTSDSENGIYHFTFTKAGNDAKDRELYYISPVNAPKYFAYNKNTSNEGGNVGSIGLTNNTSTKEEKGKWYIFDDGTYQFIVPAWRESDGTYSRGGCCWNRNSTDNKAVDMWGRGTIDPNFNGQNRLSIKRVNEEIDVPTDEVYNISVSPSNGTLYKWDNGTEKTGQTWNYKWVSNSTDPQITITSENKENNIQIEGTTLDFRGGNNDNNNTYGTETFKIAVSAGYVITGFEFDYQKASTAYYTANIKIDETTIGVDAQKKTYKKENINLQTTSFTVEEENKGILLSNFKISIKKGEIPNNTEIKASNGRFTASNSDGTWHSRWESNEIYGLSLSTSANNMSTSGDYITGASGSSGESTYTINAPQGMVVAAYSFDFVNNEGDNYSVTLAVNGKSYTSSSTTQRVSVELKTPDTSATFKQSGSNKTIKFTNFFVTLKKDDRVIAELFKTEREGTPYRIPAIAKANNGTLLAFTDYRPCGKDIGYGEVDIMLRKSYDNGKNWSSEQNIADGQGGNSNVFNVGFGDAAVVADRESGKVLVMCVAGKQVFYQATATSHNYMAKITSNDNGETWSTPQDVTSHFITGSNALFPETYAMFFGSGRILQSTRVKTGKYYRIYGALLIKHASSKYSGNCNFVVYSDDFGDTWNILGGSIDSGMCCNGGDEPKVEELPNGNIVLSSRMETGRYFNIFTFTNIEKAEGSWGTVASSTSAVNGISTNNACNGEIMILPAKKKNGNTNTWIALQSVPFGSGRSNVGIYWKLLENEYDYNTPANFAKDWDGRKQISTIGSAYSTMCLQSDGALAFLYEESTHDAEYTIQYKKIDLEDITQGEYTTEFNITYTIDGEAYQVETYKYSSKITPIKAPEKEGYTFTGWSGLPETMPSKDITVNGIYDVNTYTVTYMVDGEFFAADNVAYGSKITPREEPVKEGYTFSGWSEIPATMPAEDITVWGVFTKDEVTCIIENTNDKKEVIVYNLNGEQIYTKKKLPKGVYIIDGRKVVVK